MNHYFIAQRIARAPDFWGTTLLMTILRDSVITSVITDYKGKAVAKIRAVSGSL